MPANIKNTFHSSKMNVDSDSRLIPNGEYRSATNIRVAKSQGGDVGALENSLSNKRLTDINFGDDAKSIGFFTDTANDRLYWFVVSGQGSYLVEYDVETTITSVVLEDTRDSGNSILNLNLNYLITGINLITNNDNGISLLCWTDNLNPPRCINIARAKTYGVNGFNDADISLIKAPPLYPPEINLSFTPSNEENNIEDRFLRFAYQYQYLDGEYSTLSPFTETAFLPRPFRFNYALASNVSMLNMYNNVDIEFNTGSNLIRAVRLLFKESGSNNVYLIDSFNKENEQWDDNEDVNFSFNNNKVYQVLPSDQLGRLYDAVPLRAKSQELIGNRIVFGDYTEQYDIVDCDGAMIPIDFSLEKLTSSIELRVATRSLKTSRSYEIGLVYLDDYGRTCTALTSPENTIFFHNLDSPSQNQIKVILKSKAPCWASKYRFFIKQPRVDYDTITPGFFYDDGVYTWLKLEGDEVNKIKEGENINVKADALGILPEVVKTRVLEIKDQPVNFLEGPIAGVGPSNPSLQVVTDTIEQIPGTYYRILATMFDVNRDDFFEYEFLMIDGSEYGSILGNAYNIVEKPVYYGDGISGLNDLSANVGDIGSGAEVDIRYLVEIDTLGDLLQNTWRWSKDDGETFSTSKAIQADAAQTLENDVQITFANDAGHSLNDSWIIPYKAPSDNNLGNDQDSKAYAIFKSLDIDLSEGTLNEIIDNQTNIVDAIVGGSRIRIVYDETGEATEKLDKIYTTSKDYANLEEWFYGDNIIDSFGSITEDRIWFRRGLVQTSPTIGIYPTASIDLDIEDEGYGSMCMIIRSSGTQNSELDGEAIVRATIEIFQPGQNVVFETIPENDDSQPFFEIGRTYDIDSSGNHLGFDSDDVDQTTDDNAELILPTFNCYTWGTTHESYKINDLFNANSFKIDTRPLEVVDDYRQNTRIASMTYSKPYEQSTNYNGINEFNLSTVNWKDLDDRYGSIQKLYSENTNLLVFQEDKAHRILFEKDVLFDADGEGNIRESSNILGQETPIPGEFGISKEPESFAVYGNNKYHTDSKRGALLRLGANGYTEISKAGMRDFFRDRFIGTRNGNKVGAIDLYNKQYVLFVDNPPAGNIPVARAGTPVEVFNSENPVAFTSKVSANSGVVSLNYTLFGGDISITVEENGVDTYIGDVIFNLSEQGENSGSLSYTRSNSKSTDLIVKVTPVTMEASYLITVPDPVASDASVTANNDEIDVFEAKSELINVLFNDVYPANTNIVIQIVSQPDKGTATLNATQRTITYTHTDSDLLADSFTYRTLNTATQDSDTATVSITVLDDVSGGDDVIAFNISEKSFFSSKNNAEMASGFPTNLVRYHNGVNVYPVINDVIFTDIDGFNEFAGGGKWYAIDGGKAILINDNGSVSDLWLFGITNIYT